MQRIHNSKCNEESCAVWSKNSIDVEWQQTIGIAADTISRPRCELSWYKFYRYTVHKIYAAKGLYIHTYRYTDTQQLQRQDCLTIAFWFSKYDTLDCSHHFLLVWLCDLHLTCTLVPFTEERGINWNHTYLAIPQYTNSGAKTIVACSAQGFVGNSVHRKHSPTPTSMYTLLWKMQ